MNETGDQPQKKADKAVRQRQKTEINDRIIDFAVKRAGVKEQYDDHFVTIYASSLLGRRFYRVDWNFEDEEPNYTAYVGEKLDDPAVLEYHDDEKALIHSLSVLYAEDDKSFKATKLKQWTDMSLDAIAGLIALIITGMIGYVVIKQMDAPQLWNVFAVIIGYYFGKSVTKSPASPLQGTARRGS
jgi:hypothetical protein